MRNIDKFSITTAIIGLIVDIVTIAGFSSGVFLFSDVVPNGISKPIVEKLSFVILLYCNAVILVWISSFYIRKIKRLGVTKREAPREALTIIILTYALWTPSFLVWADWYFLESSTGWLIFGTVAGGLGLLLVASAISELIEPYGDLELTDKPPPDSD